MNSYADKRVSEAVKKTESKYKKQLEEETKKLNMSAEEILAEKERELLVKNMCQFWKVEGKNFKMGLGVYGNNRYHIDTQGHRTWGKDYKSTSSPCLKK